ncbi:MAG: RHS repeat-associated core domain-containing protein [Chloroflexi bacterium]|nr:RHS repeat-associated core domain-containing protein [Chloroflexota bacterium]
MPTDILFTGQRLDGTGLYYYGARYYDAEIGRFISPDSIVQSYANPQSLNRFSYVMNNPLRFVDPTGRLIAASGSPFLPNFLKLLHCHLDSRPARPRHPSHPYFHLIPD